MLTYPNQSAVSTRDLAWNVAGENLANEPMTGAEAIEKGGLAGWNVRHMGIQTVMGDTLADLDDSHIVIPNQRAVLATIDGKVTPLGVVGSKHTLVQNEETVDLLDTIVDDSGAHFVAAGKLKAGRQTFVVMKMPRGILIDGADAHDMYMGCSNFHEGGSLTAWTTLMRLRCTNMLNSSMKGAKSKWRLRHTSSIGGRVQDARQSLRLTYAWAGEFEKALTGLLHTPMSETEFNAFVEHIAPPSTSDKAGWVARAEEKRQTLRHLFFDAETNEFGRGTRYAAYNAATEYADWFLPIRSKAPQARAERTLADTTVENFKQTALDALLAPA